MYCMPKTNEKGCRRASRGMGSVRLLFSVLHVNSSVWHHYALGITTFTQGSFTQWQSKSANYVLDALILWNMLATSQGRQNDRKAKWHKEPLNTKVLVCCHFVFYHQWYGCSWKPTSDSVHWKWSGISLPSGLPLYTSLEMEWYESAFRPTFVH